MTPHYTFNYTALSLAQLSPFTESDQYGPVELVLRAVGLWTTGVDERVNGCQNEALLVKLLQLVWQLPHR